jgi:hypothetical protein
MFDQNKANDIRKFRFEMQKAKLHIKMRARR